MRFRMIRLWVSLSERKRTSLDIFFRYPTLRNPYKGAAVYIQVGFSLKTLHYPPQSPLCPSGRLRQRVRGEEYGLAPSPLQGEGWGGVMQSAQT
jgi:hypothetical protein